MHNWRAAERLGIFVVGAVVVSPVLFLACSNRARPVDRKSTEELLGDLATSDDRLRIAALKRLTVTQGRTMTPPLAVLLKDQSQPVRMAAVAALGDLKDPAGAEALWRELNSPYQSVDFKLAAARAMANLNDRRAIDHLIQSLPASFAEASAGLLQFGDAAIEPLIRALNDATSRTAASVVLVSIGAPAIDPLIKTIRTENNRNARLAIVKVLSEFDDARASAVVQQALKDRTPEMIAATYRFLIRQGDPESEPVLISTLSEVGRREMAEDYATSRNPKLQRAAEAWAKRTGDPLKGRISELPEVFWGGLEPNLRLVNLYHFDGKLTSVKGDAPAESKQVSYVPGKFGQAISVERGGRLTYPLERNLSFADGTIEMWISPMFNGDDPVYRKYNHALLLYDAPKANQFLVSEGNFGGFYAGTVINQAFTGAGGGNFSAWKARTWHHIAFTYSSRHNCQRLYLDGVLTTERTGPMPEPDPDNRTFTFGCDPYGNWTAFAVDEFQIWSGEKTAGGIRAAATRQEANPDR